MTARCSFSAELAADTRKRRNLQITIKWYSLCWSGRRGQQTPHHRPSTATRIRAVHQSYNISSFATREWIASRLYSPLSNHLLIYLPGQQSGNQATRKSLAVTLGGDHGILRTSLRARKGRGWSTCVQA